MGQVGDQCVDHLAQGHEAACIAPNKMQTNGCGGNFPADDVVLDGRKEIRVVFPINVEHGL